ncbi:DUF5723 family protein [Algibacter mikhailovii]|uniref:DUF5723 domain-containing protein n=1 Tax=Algibacter mikhailovii TaxID=425498 RepID=A0A918QYB3_9FLAO|nr:DUF5723 family protein [Algibacter mikhailovii]GGZ79255.1 hypothetical protein GCM10007028_16010 [Algibacter mikhailovii]
MKKHRAYLLFFLCVYSVAQNKQILYGFNEIPQSLLLNPGAEVSNMGYIGVPLLSHVHINGGTSGPTVYDLFSANGVNFNEKFRSVVYNSDSRDFLSANEQLEVFSGGFAIGNTFEKTEYLSFGVYQELDVISYIPTDYIELALEGNQNNINRVFNAGDLSARAEVVSVFHLGYNKKVNSRFNYGIRGKLYSSVVDIDATKNKGSFTTRRGTNNIYEHIFNLDMQVRTSGIASLTSDDNSGFNEDLKEISKRAFFGGNLGLGFDVGFTYNITDQWRLDGSVLDVGFISHSKDVENYVVNGNYVFEGINPLFPDVANGQSAQDYWDALKEDFEDLFDVDTTGTKYTTWRPIKFNGSLNYTFGKKKKKDCDCTTEDSGYLNAVGAQLYAISRPKQPQMALTVYYYRKLFEGLSLKGTYTLDSYSFYNLGLGVAAQLSGFGFYVMADNFLQYENIYNAEGLSLQLGFNYIFNKK